MSEPTMHTADGETARILGRLESSVGAIENRIQRLEITSATRMSVIEQKLDGVVNSLAQGLGAMKLVHWLGGGVLALMGFLASIILRQLP